MDDEARAIVNALGMSKHPEGGWYVERWRADPGATDASAPGTRPAASAILYLLAAGERSHWHRVDAAEVWQWSGGGALELRIWAAGDAAVTTVRLGGDVAGGDVTGGDVTGGDTPQAVVPVGAWQAARPLGAWALVGCIVAPAFDFAGFELAPPDWEPPLGAQPSRMPHGEP